MINNWGKWDWKHFSRTFKKVFLYFFSIFTRPLWYTLYSEVRPKSTNHHSHNCNYCINTKQHTGDAQNMYDYNETREGLQYSNGKKNKQKHLSRQNYRQRVGIFLSTLVLCVAVSHKDQTQNVKMVSRDKKRALQRWRDMYHGGELDNVCHGRKGDKGEAGDKETKRDVGFTSTLNSVSLVCKESTRF